MNLLLGLVIVIAIIALIILVVIRKSGFTLGNSANVDISRLKRFLK